MKVKVIDSEHEKDLEQEINNKELIDDFSDYLKIDKNYSKNTLESYIRDLRFFLEYTNKEVIDIKYSTSIAVSGEDQIFCFSALIMYK